jgi:hypothetical protein
MFTLNAQTEVVLRDPFFACDEASQRAAARFHRDLHFTLKPSAAAGSRIIIERDPALAPEAWTIDAEDRTIALRCADSLGVVYGLSYISHRGLGIEPLWFWNDQRFTRKTRRTFPAEHASSGTAAYRFRGWFINDEVLLSSWNPGSNIDVWEMAFEALLRLGGNIVIPGTDGNSKLHASLASDMGLWITHHHAEPLGSEMFSRAYPDLEPSYLKHADLFEKLWNDALERQKDQRVVWTIGFRGQGDLPFWEGNPYFDTDEKRGSLITSILEKQASFIRTRNADAILACNLYGESVDLYARGFIRLPGNVIRIWGDNGYGKMVSRRQGLLNPRLPALPEPSERKMMHGMYYHVSFYDLQAANHITMTPVSLDLLGRELTAAREAGIDDLIVVNVSNIRPHVMPAAFLADFWNAGSINATDFLFKYVRTWFAESPEAVLHAFTSYSRSALSFGSGEDEKAGEQLYCYTVRGVLSAWMKGKTDTTIESLRWFVSGSFTEQVRKILEMSLDAAARYKGLVCECESVSAALTSRKAFFDATLGMHARLYASLSKVLALFTESAVLFTEGKFIESFIRCGESAEENMRADAILRSWERGKWRGFYANDCLADVSYNTYLLKVLMEYIRTFDDSPGYFKWQRYFAYPEKDRNVVLLTNWEKHMTAWELYLASKMCNILKAGHHE